MRCRTGVVIIILAVLSLSLNAQNIRVALFYGIDVQSVVFSTVEGEYMLSGDGQNVAVIRKGSIFHIEQSSSGMVVHDTLQSYGAFNNLEFIGTSKSNVFQIKSVFPSLPSMESDDNLSVRIVDDALRLINRLSLEKYITGTVEAEGGFSASLEYYKAQAVIARTFAIKNFHRHAHEGFNLCDGVHCQAYKGKSRMNAQIYASTLSTKDEILTDMNGNPVITAYHASCGGTTAQASVEWNSELPYLVSINDPFCSNSGYRNWSKTISLPEWNAYLAEKGYSKGSGNLFSTTETGRQKYLDREDKKLLLSDIRAQLKLKSSFFYVEPGANSVIIHGHGYGHGLGLCQEGAMEMARVGYSYVDILMFYYHNLSLSKYSMTGE
jgi:stage II sporulation protein D